MRKNRFLQGLIGIAILATAECAGPAAIGLVLTGTAQAQDFPFLSRQRPSRNEGFFQQLFGSPNRRSDERDHQQQQAPADYSRAPAARKVDPKTEQPAPTTSVVVLGDGMADWLAYGLEDAFSDMPEVGIVRKSKVHSGLLRYDAKNDIDWWHAARDILGVEKPNYVIMMLGVSDRQNIREKDIAKEAEKKAGKDQPAVGDQTAQNKDAEDGEQSSIVAPEPPEPQAGRRAGSLEFRGDQWEKIYSRRIDETVAALKSKGVPVFWVGLPSIRGTKSTADTVYLNDLYRARAEKAGAVYIDVWDGFVDEAGKYTTFGPDYEGQMRRLRSGDGVYFTKYGARKLAHYVERELRRYMNNRGPLAFPSGPMGPVPADAKSVARPVAGPVVPLTMTSGNADELLGGSGVATARADATAVGVLVKGDAVSAPSGRADDFVWPRGSVAPPAPPVASAPPAAASASITVPAVARPVSAKPEPIKSEPVSEPAAKPPLTNETKPKAAPQPAAARSAPPAAPKPSNAKPAEVRPPRAVANAPRPPQPVHPARPRNDGLFGSNGPFGWMERR